MAQYFCWLLTVLKGHTHKKGLFIFIFFLTEYTFKIDLQYLCSSFFKTENAYKIVLFPPSSRKSASPGKTYSACGSFLLFFFHHHYCEYYYYRMQRTKNKVNASMCAPPPPHTYPYFSKVTTPVGHTFPLTLGIQWCDGHYYSCVSPRMPHKQRHSRRLLILASFIQHNAFGSQPSCACQQLMSFYGPEVQHLV